MHKRYLAVACGVLVLVGIAYWFASRSSLTQGSTPGTALPVAQSADSSLFLTLQDPSSGIINIYTYGLKSQSLAPFLHDGKNNISPSFSPDGKHMAYASRATSERAFQIYVANADGTNPREVTTDASRFKREPVWSHDGTLIAYIVQPENPALSISAPNNWNVYITDLDGHALPVGTGINPFFSPDDKTLYVLRNSGLDAINLPATLNPQNGSTTKAPTISYTLITPPITGPGTIASQTMKLSVSPDGSHIAWSAPLGGLVRVFAVHSWSPILTMTAEHDIKTQAFYSAFSPDSSMLALQEVAFDVTGRPINAHILAYRLVDWTSTDILSLSAYPVSYMWLTAWR